MCRAASAGPEAHRFLLLLLSCLGFFEVSDLSSVQQGCGADLHELTLQKWAGRAWLLKVLESFVG